MITSHFDETKDVSSITIRKAYFDEPPLFSFVIPTYKRADLLQFAVQSILGQKNLPQNCEVLISDNNPIRNDETELMMSKFTDSRISYYKNSENIGGVGNWNRCYLLAQGVWGIMLHDDDMLYPDYFQYIEHTMQLYKEAIAFFPSFNSDSFEGGLQPSRTWHRVTARYIKTVDFLEACILACPLGMCVKREFMLKTGGFDASSIPAIDYDLYVRLTQVGQVVKLYGYPLGTWRIMDNDSKNRNVMLDCLSQMKSIQKMILMDMGRAKWYTILAKRNRYFDYQHIRFWYREMRNSDPAPMDIIHYSWLDKLLFIFLRIYFVLNRHLRRGTKHINKPII